MPALTILLFLPVHASRQGPGGSRCLVSRAAGRVSLAPCLEAIAAGDNREVFTLSEEGTLASAIIPGQCASVADGDAGGDLVTGLCRSPEMAIFELSPSSQLKLPKIGNYCVSIQGGRLRKNMREGSMPQACVGVRRRASPLTSL